MSNLKFKKPRRRVERLFLHCSASDRASHDNVATIRKWHKARGFSDIGYHFFIHKNGKISRGRDIEKIPAAQQGNIEVLLLYVCMVLKRVILQQHNLNRSENSQKI